MQIDRAYCLELDDVVDIYAARDAYFSQAPPRADFHFLCSDEPCRRTNKTKVIGVNYRKLVEESEHYVRPHYRAQTEHIDTCEWVEYERAQIEVQDEANGPIRQSDDTRRRNRKTPKFTNVVDIYVPSTAGGGRVVERTAREKFTEIKLLPNPRDRIEAYKDYLRNSLKNNPNQSSVLKNVVASYFSLQRELRKTTKLKIGTGPWRSYWECFRPIKYYDKDIGNNFIYYGGLRGRRYGPNYSLTFIDRVAFGEEVRGISIYIEKSDLDKYKRHSFLIETLEEIVSRRVRYATCYFYGDIRPSIRNANFLSITIRHFDNLVLRLK